MLPGGWGVVVWQVFAFTNRKINSTNTILKNTSFIIHVFHWLKVKKIIKIWNTYYDY